ncbi:MAG: transglycosylase SLT domain-containing protein [Gammaproteobacteria bacterium]|nr:transglycosylase SLT domain-containing protein [Gammaproteobacteria bacterium]
MILQLVGCHHRPPTNKNNLCTIFTEKKDWYVSALNTQRKWGVPVHVSMAIMYQESSFISKAKPPMNYVLDVIPIGRVSSAYGFSQAKVQTWLDYVKDTGNSYSSRDDFNDAMDFMGWYLHKTFSQNNVIKTDAYNHYLNYHEGWTGFKNKSYIKKQWLINVARKVKKRAQLYQYQYRECKNNLKTSNEWF